MMKEISRRAMSGTNTGMACGPVFEYAVDAEIVVEDQGRKIFLHTQWVNLAGDLIEFEASTESLYDYYEQLNRLEEDDDEAFDRIIAERDRTAKEADISRAFGKADIYERYSDQYQQLLQMMQDVLDRDEAGIDIFHLEDEEDGFDEEDEVDEDSGEEDGE